MGDVTADPATRKACRVSHHRPSPPHLQPPLSDPRIITPPPALPPPSSRTRGEGMVRAPPHPPLSPLNLPPSGAGPMGRGGHGPVRGPRDARGPPPPPPHVPLRAWSYPPPPAPAAPPRPAVPFSPSFLSPAALPAAKACLPAAQFRAALSAHTVDKGCRQRVAVLVRSQESKSDCRC